MPAREVDSCPPARLQSPQLLQLSGIGDAGHAASSSAFRPVVDLPGVGANLQDHYQARVNPPSQGSNGRSMTTCAIPFKLAAMGLDWAAARPRASHRRRRPGRRRGHARAMRGRAGPTSSSTSCRCRSTSPASRSTAIRASPLHSGSAIRHREGRSAYDQPTHSSSLRSRPTISRRKSTARRLWKASGCCAKSMPSRRFVISGKARCCRVDRCSRTRRSSISSGPTAARCFTRAAPVEWAWMPWQS